MEIFFVYSLVFLFLVGLALFSMLVLAREPDREETAPAPAHPSPPASRQESLIAYCILAALLLFFTIVTLQSREQRLHFQLDMRK